MCVCVCHVRCVNRTTCAVLTEVGVPAGDVGVIRLRRCCRLRTLNLRMDSRLRLARLRNEAVLLKPPPSSPPPPERSMLLETKVSAPCRERRMLPTQSVTWVCATVSFSSR